MEKLQIFGIRGIYADKAIIRIMGKNRGLTPAASEVLIIHTLISFSRSKTFRINDS